MFADRKPRLISYHDTWISVDPIQGCPYTCSYCVLRHASRTGVRPLIYADPREAVEELLRHPLFRRHLTPVALGNETDMFHPANQEYLLRFLEEFDAAQVTNPLCLVTKAPLSAAICQQVRRTFTGKLVFFLSYSGLDSRFEPNFSDRQLRRNFAVARQAEFPVVHFWRPLLPANTSRQQIARMLRFSSRSADAAVVVGLKLHPELNRLLAREEPIQLPQQMIDQPGEWIDKSVLRRVYSEAQRICPEFPLYRHTSCALAYVLRKHNHTGTVYRQDVCLPSHCPSSQRATCGRARRLPAAADIEAALQVLNRPIFFERQQGCVLIKGTVTQEEFAFLLHSLNCPIQVDAIRFQNLYQGDIYAGQRGVMHH